jgi:23S rRNA pseudouridine2605 synthase
MAERLQKVLARAGIASRRQAEELIRAGRVYVNGQRAEIGQSVAPHALIAVDGKPIQIEQQPRYIALNKPAGYVTSTRSTHGERTILELVSVPERIFPVGRLDKETAGLLLLTNDGEWANRIMHPRYGVEKEYRVLVHGIVDAKALERFRQGVVIEGHHTAPVSVRRLAIVNGNTWLAIVLTEGRKREIRLLASAVGHPVLYLERVRIGEVQLGSLPIGHWRALSKREVESFYDGTRTGNPSRSRTTVATKDRHRWAGRRR